MTANIQWGKGTFNDPNKLGGAVPPPVAAELPQFDRWPLMGQLGQATLLLEYVVPAGKVETLKNLLVTVMPPGSMFAPAGVGLRMGTALLVVDGATKAELSIQNYNIQNQTISWSSDWKSCREAGSLGEGVDFTVGQVVKVQVNPLSSQAGLVRAEKYFAHLLGKDPTTNAANLQKGVLRSPATGAALDILSYTAPANGFRLMSWDVTGVYVEPWCATVQVFINGACVVELGYLGFHGETTVFGPQGHHGVINLLKGGWGIKLNHGDRVEVFGHALLDFGQAAGVQMAVNEVGEIGLEPILQIGV